MNTERWERLSEVVKAALECPAAERAMLLDRTCAGDDELRREAESLLAYDDTEEGFIETSAMKLAARQLAGMQREIAAGNDIRHYRIIKSLGTGGMGKVYLAEDTRLQRPVAIKFLTEKFADSDRARRFEREALTVSSLRHPNIIIIHEHFHHEGLYLLVTEFVEGETLRPIIGRGAMNWREAVKVATQIAAALNAAHAAGIVHRDIKPENVIRQPDGHVKVLDFGIAKHLERAEQVSDGYGSEQASDFSTVSVARTEKTRTGQFFYTLGYASPEQARGERELDGRTDIFSLGVMMFEMLAGKRLFPGATAEEKIAALLTNQEAPDVREFCPDIPAALSTIVAKALRKQRELRHQSASDLLTELQELRSVIESPTPEKAAAQIAARSANRLLTQFTVRYLEDPGTRIPLLTLWTIRRSANLRRGQKENELLRKSLHGGLMKLGAWALALAVIATIFAAWMSIAERWDERVLSDGHKAGVRRAGFSPDGRWLVSVGEDNRVRVWDFARRELKRELNDHTAWVVAVSFAPDGRFFATASWDRSVIVWDVESLEIVTVLPDSRGPFIGVTFSPDGKYLAAGINVGPGVTGVWRVGSWEKHREIPMYTGDWSPLLFSPKQPHLLLNGSQIFDAETGQELRRPADFAFSSGVEFSQDGSRLVTVRSAGEVVFYDTAREQMIGPPLFVHHDNGRAAAFSPDGKLAATGAEDIILWNAVTQEIITRWDYSAEVWGLTWSPDGRYLVSTHDNGSILLWDVIARERAGDLAQHSSPVATVAFSPDGQHIASGSEDRSVLIWNTASGRKEAALVGHQSHVNGVAFSRDSQWIVSNGWDGELIRWELAGRQPRWRVKTTLSSKRISISPDGRWIAASDGIYDATTGKPLFHYSSSLGIESWATMSASTSADGKRLAGAGSGRLCVWETDQWRLLGRIEVGNSGGAVMSPDGRHIIIGNINGELLIFQTEPLVRLGRLGSHATRVKQIAFSPDGTEVASVGDDQKIKLWQFAKRRLKAEIGIHTASIPTTAFSPDGKQLVSGGHDKSVRVYTRHLTLWGGKLEESNWLLRLFR